MSSFRRVSVFRSGYVEGKVFRVPGTLEELLEDINSKLRIHADKLYNSQGALVDDLTLVRDSDILHASEPNCDIMASTDLNSCETSAHSITLNSLSKPSTCSQLAQDSWATLNVGGTYFTTTVNTLVMKEPTSMLARMFSPTANGNSWSSRVDHKGAYLIDRSPRYFEPILNYLRHGEIIIDKNINVQGVLEEAKFFGMTGLVDVLEAMVDKDAPPSDDTPITRRELTLALMSTSVSTELRCQGLNFSGANLSKLDLRQINFKYANFTGVNLSGANLSHCNFERADLSHANLDGANLLGVKMLCAHLEGTSLVGCNFEDPAGSRANMEGAIMKNVNLEGSHMASVNLRVATLKNSNLQNCDLRGAVLAGADLENCDLSGCDLQEANLRGANLKGAMFELMLNPLHMSQTVR